MILLAQKLSAELLWSNTGHNFLDEQTVNNKNDLVISLQNHSHKTDNIIQVGSG